MGMLLDQNDTAFVDNVLDEFAAWLQTVGDPYPDDSVANAAVFIDWRRRHFAADLAAFDEDDVVEFPLDWCPRRITMPAEASSWFCASIGALLEFLGNTGLPFVYIPPPLQTSNLSPRRRCWPRSMHSANDLARDPVSH
jgi:hypothetical protein